MQKLYKQFVESATRWITNSRNDEFLVPRLKLTFYYSITAIVILGGSSFILYSAILSNFTQSILENVLDPNLAQAIIDRAQDILLNRFITIDAVIIFFIIILGFFLTSKTLKPIKLNMEKQKRFIADASHELRTPIAVVVSGLEVTLSNKKLDFSSAKKTLEDVLDEMREFSKLSNSLLDISKYDTKIKIEHEPVNINELVKSVVEKSENLAQAKEINFKTAMMMDSAITIKGNKMDLSRVFYNILDNAIKYTPQNGTVFISDKIVLNNYVLTVNDSGVGIPRNIINRIFDPFFRGNESRNTSGAGLGLTLTKKIIESHQGTVLVKSQEGKGTNVMISLPASS